jgi:hypothetical protein
MYRVMLSIMLAVGIASPALSDLGHDMSEISDCQEDSPNVTYMLDPAHGHYLISGADTQKMKDCLKSRYGWTEKGPPQFKPNVMAPPER